MTSDLQTLHDTALSFLKSYETLTAEAVLEMRTPDCIHQAHPASLKRPAMSNDEYAVLLGSAKEIYQNYRIVVKQGGLFIDVEKMSALVHADGTADTIIGPFHNEYVFFLKMDKTGKKVQRVNEFVDSAFVADFSPRLTMAWEKAQGGSEECQ